MLLSSFIAISFSSSQVALMFPLYEFFLDLLLRLAWTIENLRGELVTCRNTEPSANMTGSCRCSRPRDPNPSPV